MVYIGIDPGRSGGIAALDEEGAVVYAAPMPDSHLETLAELGACAVGGEAVAMLELVHSSPQMGVVSAFTFGRGYGALEMALTSRYIKFDRVVPLKWQTALACRTHGDKNVSKQRAIELFPSCKKVTHAIADALLIAEYCRRWHTGSLARVPR